jgi:hypothetical protein
MLLSAGRRLVLQGVHSVFIQRSVWNHCGKAIPFRAASEIEKLSTRMVLALAALGIGSNSRC